MFLQYIICSHIVAHEKNPSHFFKWKKEKGRNPSCWAFDTSLFGVMVKNSAMELKKMSCFLTRGLVNYTLGVIESLFVPREYKYLC